MKLVAISGGSRGLGLALAKGYLEAGYQVVEFSRSAPHAFSVPADFSDPEGARAAVAAELGRLAALEYQEIVIVNNAATVQPIGPTSRKEPAEVLYSLNVNVSSAVLFLSEAIRKFQAHPCRKTIVNISSGAALRPYYGWSLYCASKACLETFVRSVALEQGAEPHPFLAISIEPGIIDTEMQAAIRASSEHDFPDLKRFVELKRSGALRSAEQVADAIRSIVRQNHGNGVRYEVRDFAG
ncbi:benzil reductase ((S)-benzoin forming) [Geomonas limicola]|uniref:Benzil reductase ((S)-benzoin forming) n=1 Tax=Geomonas limicola TaxID=2740186 RepID=A0A6V8NET1_9BACT|nr:SDR family NAD(P)-dependent oxidoreductase [Geomonas limicola]GFO70314.1 benzil reductase ((S)-benzoin forming) [Geomonas limicola]